MNTISSTFFRLGLIGWPVAHSLSPIIHAAALQATGLQGEYQLYPIDPDSPQAVLDDLLMKLRQGEIHGLNVTVPHKERMLSQVNFLSQAAQSIGAVNTLVFHNGGIFGENTDAPGFLNHLQRLQLLENGRKLRCLILGAGGSARAVVYALARAGHIVAVTARREAQAQNLVAEISQSQDFSTLPVSLPMDFQQIKHTFQPDLLVNTTPVGMHPHPEQTPWPLEIPLPESCRVYDLIYNPAQTLLLRQARQAGLPAVNGLGMLVEQAAISFAIWTGIEPPIARLYDAVEMKI